MKEATKTQIKDSAPLSPGFPPKKTDRPFFFSQKINETQTLHYYTGNITIHSSFDQNGHSGTKRRWTAFTNKRTTPPPQLKWVTRHKMAAMLPLSTEWLPAAEKLALTKGRLHSFTAATPRPALLCHTRNTQFNPVSLGWGCGEGRGGAGLGGQGQRLRVTGTRGGTATVGTAWKTLFAVTHPVCLFSVGAGAATPRTWKLLHKWAAFFH